MSATRIDIAASLPAPPEPGAGTDWALFLDVDGTLLDFVQQPGLVEVDPELRHDLSATRAHLEGALALLSGRPLSQLDELFDWQDCPAAGLHGAELRMPGDRIHITGDDVAFAKLRRQAETLVSGEAGVLLEDKRRALALHYRRAPEARAAAEHIADALLRCADGAFAVQRGDHVIELKPAGVDKGRALATLMLAAPFRGRVPYVLGDDLTDEDAFAGANAAGGVSVIVGGRRPTAARFALAEPTAARAWLHRRATRDTS